MSKHTMQNGMKTYTSPFLRNLLISTVVLLAQPAIAASHALVMWIGDYPSGNALPGIEKDAAMAKKMARSMGVDDTRIVEVSNRDLTPEGIQIALENLTQRIGQGDQVFIYYSGHGTQARGAEGGKCSEGMVASNLKTFDDSKLEPLLQGLAKKAGQVLMFNDSCFSGGQATKAFSSKEADLFPKALPTEKLAFDKAGEDYRCGNAINTRSAKATKSTMDRFGSNFLYIAASSEREVSFATSSGSAATTAWVHCLVAATDRDRSGALSGEEIRACAQGYLAGANPARRVFNQNISLLGNANLPLTFVAATPVSAPVEPIRADAAFNDIRNASNSKMEVQLSLANDRLKIGKDKLLFQVNTKVDGYLYVLFAGPDGKQIDTLYPNAKAKDNFVKAGRHEYPGPAWALRSSGPAGTGYLIALVSEKPMSFNGSTESSAMALTTQTAQKLLTVIGSESASVYGASAVMSVTEY
jgi:hypothetical protein